MAGLFQDSCFHYFTVLKLFLSLPVAEIWICSGWGSAPQQICREHTKTNSATFHKLDAMSILPTAASRCYFFVVSPHARWVWVFVTCNAYDCWSCALSHATWRDWSFFVVVKIRLTGSQARTLCGLNMHKIANFVYIVHCSTGLFFAGVFFFT